MACNKNLYAPNQDKTKLKNMMPPCWIFLTGWANNISSSQMKAKKKIYAKPNSN